jgi:YcaO-like protein with predicted kinase domain
LTRGAAAHGSFERAQRPRPRASISDPAPTGSAPAFDLGGTLRDAPVDATLAKARGILRAVGITRVANVTGLDHVGVPTWLVVRPLARSLTVSQGKGLTHELAQASGIMESIEVHHAEHFVPRGHRRSLRAAARDPAYVNPLLLPVRPRAKIVNGAAVEWIEARDIATGARHFVPREMVDLGRLSGGRAQRIFVSSSSGLASGNSRTEALLHGVCEVIERDQETRWYARKQFEPGFAGSRLWLESVTDEHCRALFNRCADAQLAVHVCYVTQDIAVPCFMCTVFDHRGHTLYPQRAAGFGCHPYRRIALLRAITEALQSRLTFIAGARDDVYWSEYRNGLCIDDAPGADWARSLEVESLAIDYAHVPEAPAMTDLSALLAWTLARLCEQGFERALAVDLTQEAWGIPVVHVTVPGLEGLILKPNYTPGPRMQAFLSGRLPS